MKDPYLEGLEQQRESKEQLGARRDTTLHNWSQTWDFQRGEHSERVRKSEHRTKPAPPRGKRRFMIVYDHNNKNFVGQTSNFRFLQHFSLNQWIYLDFLSNLYLKLTRYH